jgi:hypothetical protein
MSLSFLIIYYSRCVKNYIRHLFSVIIYKVFIPIFFTFLDLISTFEYILNLYLFFNYTLNLIRSFSYKITFYSTALLFLIYFLNAFYLKFYKIIETLVNNDAISYSLNIS